MNTLVLGGAKSGKSLFAENLAIASQKGLVYIATGEAQDDEMEERIHLHQQRREQQQVSWCDVEEPITLANTIDQESHHSRLILVDCLTLWLSNLLLRLNEQEQELEIEALLNVLSNCESEVVLVSNETGLGIVPMNKLSRQFIDKAGMLHQKIAAISDRVVLVVAGLPVVVKGTL